MKKFGKWLKAIFGKCTDAADKAYVSDTTRRGTLSKNRKYCLSLAKIKNQSQRTTTRSRQILQLAQCLRRGLRRKAKALRPAEAPPRKASDGIPILRFARGWARQQPRHLCPDRLL